MSRQTLLAWIRSSTARLAFSYLGIIMVLSMGFSVIFYRTSTAGMDTRGMTAVSQSDNRQSTVAVGVKGNGHAPQHIEASSTSGLNAQLEAYITNLQAGLLRRLIYLNAGALLLGAALSWYLARKTLQPIEAAAAAQARFSSDASHELRTPLTALRTRSEVALRNPHLTLAEAKKVITDGIAQTIKLEHLSDSLLKLSRDDRHGLTKTPLLLEEAANEAMNQAIELAQAKQITITETVPDLTVLGDMPTLVQVITILLDNAIKYSHRRSGIYIEGGTEGKRGLLYVRDEGPGIRATDLPHIFERFYRADYARAKHGGQGYGLGLAIAQKLITQQGGKITVKSTLGTGSVFTIHLPLAKL